MLALIEGWISHHSCLAVGELIGIVFAVLLKLPWKMALLGESGTQLDLITLGWRVNMVLSVWSTAQLHLWNTVTGSSSPEGHL